MPFRNSVVGGTTLVRPAIRSPNFVAGASGWSIDADGSAEFNDIVIRGTGLGDAVIIGPAGMPQVEIGSTATAGYIQFPTNRAIENHIATIIAAVGNPGAANEYATLQIQGPSVDGATDRASILVSSQNNDGSSAANINMQAGSGSVVYDETQFVIQSIAGTGSALRVSTGAGHTGPVFRAQLNGADRLIVDNDGRLVSSGQASASSAVFVNTAAGQTGNMMRLQLNGSDRFVVANDGSVTIAGNLTVTGVGQVQYARRTSDLSRNASGPTDDPQLQFSVVANAVYALTGWVKFSALDGADISVDWSAPAGALGEWTGHGQGFATTAQTTNGYMIRTETTDITASRAFSGTTGTAGEFSILIMGTLRTAATAGTYAMQWAQNTTDAANPTTVYTDSWLRLERIA